MVMMQGDLWIKRVADTSGLSYESSAMLWSALSMQIAMRLSAGYALDMGRAGCWSVRSQRELLARLPDGVWLIPPSIALEIGSVCPRSLEPLALEGHADALALSTGLPIEAVQRWLTSIPSTWQAQLEAGYPVVWSSVVTITQGAEGDLIIMPSDELLRELNKPFGMFEPVKVLHPERHYGIDERSFARLEEVYEIEPIRLEGRGEVKPESVAEVELLPTKEPEADELGEDVEATRGDETGEESALVEELDRIHEVALRRRERSRRGLWLVIFLLIALIAGLVGWQWYTESRQAATEDQPTEQVADSSRVAVRLPIRDTTEMAIDSPTRLKPIEQVEALPEPTFAPEPPASPAVGRRAETEVIVLQPGDSLMRIALEKYGHKAFWVYIYEENRELIPNPNNIPVGTQLTLPAARKYGIDPDNTNSVSRALVLQRSLMN